MTKQSPVGKYEGINSMYKEQDLLAVSILRAGNAFMKELLQLFP